jgi:ribosome-binding protein aMBF1 (putative translation factor)
MAKYSTGSGGGGDDGAACELCGAETGDLRRASVAGAVLQVCRDCAPHDDAEKRSGGGGGGASGGSGGDGGRNRRKQAARNTARVYDAARSHGKRWEREGTDYESDRLPYLVDGYGDAVASAREEAGLTRAELAAELDVEEADLLAVEEGRATRAGVGGSVVERLEERLGVELSAA